MLCEDHAVMRCLLLALLVAPLSDAQPRSTHCPATKVAVPGTSAIDLQLIGCGKDFPDNLLWPLARADSIDGSLDGEVPRRATGKGAVVYLIDTGVMRDHDEFARPTGSNILHAVTLGRPST